MEGKRITLCRRISNDELAAHPAPSGGGDHLPLHFQGAVDLWVESQGTSGGRNDQMAVEKAGRYNLDICVMVSPDYRKF